MPRKYEVPMKPAAPRFRPIGKFATVENREDCAGSCKECVKKRCVYEVFKENYKHLLTMDEPEYLYVCQSCFRCVQECTKGIFSRVVNPEYKELGDDYWRPEIISQTWYQAHTGRIPVSGAGYRGPFAGEGFDSMWTDMSEIVRPTRDGIHGREYINTAIELSRRPVRLGFQGMSLEMDNPPIVEIPLPVILRQPDFGVLSEDVLLAMARGAQALGTVMLIKLEDYTEAFKSYEKNLAPVLAVGDYKKYAALIGDSSMIEVTYSDGIESEIAGIRDMKPGLIITVGIPLDAGAASKALVMVSAGVDTLHFYADDRGRELDAEKPRFLKDMIREVHLKLVDDNVRQKVNLIFSGGIAMAEHMAKAIICGADAVCVDIPLLIALECRLCRRCLDGLSCPVKLEETTVKWGSQRIVNLIGAWRNQLIEVMGAIGIREARRLRGEVGRSLWFENLEKESFAPIFGERKISGVR